MEGQTNRGNGNPAEHTYWLICGTPDCINRTEPRPDFAQPGWPVRESELVDGEVWTCPDCRGVDWPELKTPWREHWVSWFVDGKATHFRADSPTGRAIAAKLIELEASRRPCAWPDCDEPARPKSQTCSDTHKRAVARAAKTKREARHREAVSPGSAGSGLALPDTLPTGTNGAHLPGMTRPVIADTADIPARRCANCGADISDRRADARFCKRDACRKALARRAGAIAAAADLQLAFDLEIAAEPAPRSPR